MKVFLNGEFLDQEHCSELLEPGFLFGWGVFETMRVYGKNVVFLKEHLKRMRQGLVLLGLKAPDIDFEAAIIRLLDENRLNDAYLRVSVFKKRNEVGVLIYAAEFTYYKENSYRQGAKAIIAPFVRYSQDPFLGIKAISYVRNRHAWFLAQQKQKDEAIFVNEKGFLQEGSRSNIFFVKGRDVFTPSLECGVLDGVTRKAVIHINKVLGFTVAEGEFAAKDLFEAEEAFLTSSLMEVMPLVECDGQPIGKGTPGAHSMRVLARYREIIPKTNLSEV